MGGATDITRDFVSITVLFETGHSARPPRHRPLSRDARLAQQISDQLRQQELCLRELNQLVGKKSIVGDDPSAQIATLTDVLKKELGAIERNIQVFQQTVNALRGRHQQHHRAHFSVVCQSLKSRCAKTVKAFHVGCLWSSWLLVGCHCRRKTCCDSLVGPYYYSSHSSNIQQLFGHAARDAANFRMEEGIPWSISTLRCFHGQVLQEGMDIK